MGLGLRRAAPDPRDVCQLPAAPDPPARAAADSHPARHRLQAAGHRRRARGMTGSGRLSLRSRLLVLLIAVTAAFLLVMGVVSTFVLSKRLGGQFDGELLAAAQHKPQQIASNPGDYVAVEVTFPPLAVHPLTGSGAATEELLDAVRSMIATHSARHFLGDNPFGVPRMDG